MGGMEQEHPDWALITELGGPAKVARLLELGDGGIQRVQNWKQRGIPSAVKLQRPDLFLPDLRPATEEESEPAKPKARQTDKATASDGKGKAKPAPARSSKPKAITGALHTEHAKA